MREHALTKEKVSHRPAMTGVLKALVWRIIAALPCRYWAPASAFVRRIWPGVRGA